MAFDRRGAFGFVKKNMGKAVNASSKDKNIKDLYKCFNQIALTAQLFGLLPTEGVQQNEYKKIVFKWCTLKAIYCHVVIITTFLVVVMTFYDLVVCHVVLNKIGK